MNNRPPLDDFYFARYDYDTLVKQHAERVAQSELSSQGYPYYHSHPLPAPHTQVFPENANNSFQDTRDWSLSEQEEAKSWSHQPPVEYRNQEDVGHHRRLAPKPIHNKEDIAACSVPQPGKLQYDPTRDHLGVSAAVPSCPPKMSTQAEPVDPTATATCNLAIPHWHTGLNCKGAIDHSALVAAQLNITKTGELPRVAEPHPIAQDRVARNN